MLIIAERINGMFKDVARAIKDKDKKVIQKLAKRQIEAGANALDINVGVAAEDPIQTMKWLVRAVTEVTDITLSIDTTKLAVMEEGLKLCKSRPIINSTNAQKEKLDSILPLAKKYNASVIGLTMDKKGVPQDVAARVDLASQIVLAAQEQGIDIQDLYIDAVILPVNVAQPHAKQVLETIKQCKLISDPPPKTVLGLSNVSQGAVNRPLINRTFLTMALAAGLDAALLDPLDKELVDEMITAEVLLEKAIYCDSFLEAYRKK